MFGIQSLQVLIKNRNIIKGTNYTMQYRGRRVGINVDSHWSSLNYQFTT